ncbi:3-hydroxyacyl-CoA dehydrogenase family protein [Mesobacillus maritimus]|uniref:3-hydroxyacyl-CoA dehydrogenase family protein n=1 Tax=Mesobacillus maritimus TaxID=1643336 RepID=UPI00203F4A9F|nr:3-hydroxyacyl-CoA dehydrogenase family protein [Mesobacillus maritimus]MCM3671137.1 3-hydroxyacyl-CoA dehydrogenase family protein [Mesobacillus maritimus]
MEIKKIAVIGSGVMGHGIAQSYALAGIPVNLYDIKEEFLKQALGLVQSNLTLLVKENVITDVQKQDTLKRIRTSTDLEQSVKDADFVTEVIPEIIEIKWELYAKLERFCKREAIIASNTSTFPISKLIEKSSTAERMLITHFFNPAQLVPLVEIVKHEYVTDEVLDTTKRLLVKIGKTPIVLRKDVPGFIANRLQAAVVREAFHLLEAGVADAEDIDKAVSAGPGFRWAFCGPIETADFGGLDTWQRVIDNLAPELDQRKTAPTLITQKVEQGKLGTKTGEGIYQYEEETVAERILERDTNFIRLAKIRQ